MRHISKVHSNGGIATCCHVCREYVEDMEEHFKTKHKTFTKKCDHCEMRFESTKRLSMHFKRKHTDIRSFPCLICEMRFFTKLELIKHSKARHNLLEDDLKENIIKDEGDETIEEETLIECDICGEAVNDFLYNSHQINFHQESLAELFFHDSEIKEKKADEKDIDEEQSYVCSICSKDLKSKMSLTKHIKNVHKNKEGNNCHYCRKEVINIKEHYERKHYYLQYTCNICYRKFRFQKILDKHIRFNHVKDQEIIDGEYICDYCGKVSSTKANLIKHILKH